MSGSGLQRLGLVAIVAVISGCATAADNGPEPSFDAAGQSDSAKPDSVVTSDSGAPDTNGADSGAADTSDAASTPDTATGDDAADAAETAPLDGDTCATATRLTPDASGNATASSQTTVGYHEDFQATGLTCKATIGGDRLYVVTVPAGKRLTATATPTDANYNPALNFLLGPASNCGAGDCVVPGVDSGFSGDPETLKWQNATGADADVFIVVDSAQTDSTSQGTFDLAVTVADVPAGDVCATAPAITVTGTTKAVLANETLVGYAADYGSGTGCTGTGGPDHLYRIDVPAGQRLVVTANPLSSWDVSLNLQDAASCGATPRVCVASVDAGGSGASETLTYTNTSSATQSMDIAVESYSSTTIGNYDLTVQLAPLPSNDTCTAPIVVTAPGSVTGDTTTATDDYSGGTNCVGGSGPDLVYAVDVPAGKQLAATVTSTASGGGFAPGLDLVSPASCGATGTRTCMASGLSTTASPAVTVRWTNSATSTTRVNLVVDSTSTSGPFRLDVLLADPPAGDTCANPFALTPDGTIVSGTTADGTNDYGAGTNCGAASGPDKVYSVTIPPGQRLATTVIGSSSFVPSLSAQTSLECASTPRVCQDGIAASTTTPQATLVYANESTSASETIDVVVDSSSTTGGAYSIYGQLTDTKVGDICGKAEPITVGTLVSGLTTTGYSDEYAGGSGCKPTTGPDRVFSVTVPTGKQVTVSVSPATGFDPTVSLVAGDPSRCAAHVCNVSVDANKTAGQPELATYANTTGADQTVFILVDSESTTNPAGDFSLVATLSDAPTTTTVTGGDTCGTAPNLPLSTTQVVVNGDFLGYVDDYGYPSSGSVCAYHTGPDVAYAVTIPAGKTVTVSVDSSAAGLTSYPTISLVVGDATACDPTLPCVAGNESFSATTPSSITYTNSSGVDQTGFLIVDIYESSGSFTTSTPFTMTAQLN